MPAASRISSSEPIPLKCLWHSSGVSNRPWARMSSAKRVMALLEPFRPHGTGQLLKHLHGEARPQKRSSNTTLSNSPRNGDSSMLKLLGYVVPCAIMPCSKQSTEVLRHSYGIEVIEQCQSWHRVKGLLQVDAEKETTIYFRGGGNSTILFSHANDIVTVLNGSCNGIFTASALHICELWKLHQVWVCLSSCLLTNKA